jgi:hypothetical protein
MTSRLPPLSVGAGKATVKRGFATCAPPLGQRYFGLLGTAQGPRECNNIGQEGIGVATPLPAYATDQVLQQVREERDLANLGKEE